MENSFGLPDLVTTINQLVDEVEALKSEVKLLKSKPTKSILKQSEVLKLYRISHSTLKSWVASGVHEMVDGNTIYYDTEEIEKILKERKI